MPAHAGARRTTRDAAIEWLENLKKLGWDEKVRVHVLMGGEDSEDWDFDPERPAILIGTQDMLLSRALNRGYGMSRFRWPMHFGLLNNDCLWVLDEIQLMGTGLATSTQLQAFRDSFGIFGTSQTIWMSATLLLDWLKTIDFRDRVESLDVLRLEKEDYEADGLKARWNAKKPIADSECRAVDMKRLAQLVKEKHRKGSLTLVIVNTVDRCVELFDELGKFYAPPLQRGRRGSPAREPTPTPDFQLIHSRFRPRERETWRRWLKEKQFPIEGRIVVSTQVVEAGVDISARTLITELACG